MKLAIISDIHSDAPALARVLGDMPAVDQVLCAGDAISEFSFCPDTVTLLRDANARCIRGNHEHVLFGGANPGYLAKCRDRYDTALLDMLAEAPTSIELEAEGQRVLMIHATPWSPYSGYINPGSPQLSRISALPYDYVILGHTHVAMIESAGPVTVINPGSCSQPRGADRRRSYAVLDLATREAHIRYLD
ncbi:MAG: metallophosphoesterase family protein [Hyphomicrobiaceae bacterium]